MKFTKETAAQAGAKSSRQGIPNRSTGEIREAFQMLIGNQIDNLEKWLEQLARENPGKALDVVARFAEYCIPKQSRVETTDITTVESLINLTEAQREARIKELKQTLGK